MASTASSLALVAASIADNVSTTVASSVQKTPSEPIFLQTKLAQSIAGTFVVAALFLTCQQVSVEY